MLGLVLSGGSARGYSHIGILKQLENNNISPDIITGTSMGAVIGAFIAKGYTSTQMQKILTQESILSFLSLPKREALQSGDSIVKFLEKYLKDVHIEDLQIPFGCVATDITSCEEVVFTSGNLVDALRATISLPAVFQPYKI